MSNRNFVIFIAFLLVLGFVVGRKLSTLPKLETPKLLNIAGLFYDLIGVAVLSEVVASSERWKRVSIGIIAPGILWSHFAIPLGAVLGSILSYRLPSGRAALAFALAFLIYSLTPVSILNEMVVFPQFAVLKGVESRWRWFGFLLLLTGILLQFIAALMVLGR
jgi:hypothetical protein